MSLPLAVSPGTLTPGLYLNINLLAGAGAPSLGPLKVLLIAPKASTGDLTDDTEVRTGSGEDSASVAFGPGTIGHLCAKQLYAAAPNAIVDFVAPVAGSGSATTDIVLAGAPTTNNAVEVKLAGRVYQVAWLVGETLADVRDKIIAAITSDSYDLPCTAASGGTDTVTLTSKVNGNVGNDIKVICRLVYPASSTEAITPTSMTAFTGGTTDPDYSNVLDLVKGGEYHFIVPCMSNTDAVLASSSSNAARIITHIELYNEGLEAKLQQLVYASTSTQAAAITAAISRNVGYAQHVLCVNGQSLPCEFAGAEAGDRLSAISLDPAANRIGNQIGSGLYGSADVTTDRPTQSQTESAIGNGVSIISYDSSDRIIVVRPITTYSQNSSGGADRRLLDTQNVDATYIIARDLRTALPAEFPNAKVQKDAAPGAEPPPVGVIEERDIKAFVISRLRVFQRLGVILQSALDTAIDDGSLIVQVNELDSTQVDVVVPIQIIPPLAKFGVVVNREPVV